MGKKQSKKGYSQSHILEKSADLIEMAQIGKTALLQGKEEKAKQSASIQNFTCKDENLYVNLRSSKLTTFRQNYSMRN